MKVFTTGQVAKICKVAPRTVSKWFDSGRLKGYRIPGSQDRRIPREYLIKFLKEHGMPLGDLEDEAMAKVLLVGQDQLLIENLKRHLPAENSFKIQVAASGFEAGIQAESFHLVGMVDTVFADVAQPDQARIVAINAEYFLKTGGHFVISIKANCIDSTVPAEAVFASEVKKLKAAQLRPKEQLTLEPYERDHAVVIGEYRTKKRKRKDK